MHEILVNSEYYKMIYWDYLSNKIIRDVV